MLNGCIGLVLFKFGKLTDNNERKYAWKRIIFSIMIINVLPIVFFACTFFCLDVDLNIFNLLGIFFISFFVFICYRILHVLFSYNDGKGFYSPCARARMLKERSFSFSMKGHFLGVMLYVIIVFIGFLLIYFSESINGWFNLINVKPVSFLILVSILLIFILVLWLLCAGPTENGSQPPDDECKSEKKEDDIFEQLYRDLESDIRIEDLDRLLEHELDVILRIMTWRLGLLLPFSILTFQIMQTFREMSFYWEIFGIFCAIVIFVYFIADHKRITRSRDPTKHFKKYIRIRQKLERALET